MKAASAWKVLAALAPAWVAVACAPSRPAVEPDASKVQPPQLLQLVQEHAGRLHWLVGSGSVSFEGPQGGGDAFFSIALRKPDSLLIQLEGLFGIDVGFLFLTPRHYVLYNSLNNRVFEGIPTGENLRRLMPVDLTAEQIIETFSGMIPVAARPENVTEYSIEEGRFKLVAPCGQDTCTWWIDAASLLVRRYTRVDGHGRVLVEAETGKVTEEDGLSLPKRIRVSFPESGQQIAVLYSRLTPNGPSPSFVFSVPQDARTSQR